MEEQNRLIHIFIATAFSCFIRCSRDITFETSKIINQVAKVIGNFFFLSEWIDLEGEVHCDSVRNVSANDTSDDAAKINETHCYCKNDTAAIELLLFIIFFDIWNYRRCFSSQKMVASHARSVRRWTRTGSVNLMKSYWSSQWPGHQFISSSCARLCSCLQSDCMNN